MEIDCTRRVGPTNAWVTLDTVVLTNPTRLYFDLTAFRQPQATKFRRQAANAR